MWIALYTTNLRSYQIFSGIGFNFFQKIQHDLCEPISVLQHKARAPISQRIMELRARSEV